MWKEELALFSQMAHLLSKSATLRGGSVRQSSLADGHEEVASFPQLPGPKRQRAGAHRPYS